MMMGRMMVLMIILSSSVWLIALNISPVSGMQARWNLINPNGNIPQPTCGHASSFIGNKLFVFGGCESSCCTSPSLVLWSFDIGSVQWSQVQQNANPQHRVYHSLTNTPPGDSSPMAIMWGGIDPYLGAFLGDFWIFQAPNYQWTGVYPNSALPAPRAGHSAVIMGTGPSRQLCIYGGRNAALVFSDLWCYSFATNQWTLVYTSTTPRVFHSAAIYSDSTGYNLLIYGGSFDQGTDVDDMWKYNFQNKLWNQVISGALVPPGRLGHKALVNQVGGGTYMWIFGGLNSKAGYLDDTWVFNLQSSAWANCTDVLTPDGLMASPRAHFSATTLNGTTNIIFGGFSSGNRLLSDLWYQVVLI